MMINRRLSLVLTVFFVVSCSSDGPDSAARQDVDFIIQNGVIYDGSGGAPFTGGVAVKSGRIAAVGDMSRYQSGQIIDAGGKAVSPGFINMLSWGVASLTHDGRGLSDIKQGVTLEVFGEGLSMGPVNDYTGPFLEGLFSNAFPFKVRWQSFGDYLDYLVHKGVSPNVASFVGATTLRMNYMQRDDVDPTPEQLAAMKADVRRAMEEGALGVGASLIYAPAFYAETEELIALVEAAAKYGGSYIAHMRSEGNQLIEAIEEQIAIAEATGVAAEIYHLKAAGKDNWHKMKEAIALIEKARARGLDIRANAYTYTAGSTGLNAAMPPWAQDGGLDAWIKRLQDTETRARIKQEMQTPSDEWENLWLATGSPDRVLFAGFRNPDLQHLTGKTLAEVMEIRGTDAEDTMMDLVIEDHSDVNTTYFMMSEDNIEMKIRQPWVTFGSDGAAVAPEGAFLKYSPHPRTYGNVARLLGRYVREKQVIGLAEAVRKLTSQPAANLKIRDRGWLKAGYAADIVIFDPDTIVDKATYADPHQLAVGVSDVFVNGVQVLKDGAHTGALPGQVVRGPGWTGWLQD